MYLSNFTQPTCVEECMIFLQKGIYLRIIDPATKKRIGIKNPYNINFIKNICKDIEKNQSLTTEKARICLKIINKYNNLLIVMGVEQQFLTNLANKPVYKLPLKPSVLIKRQSKYLGQNVLLLRFKYNPQIVEEIYNKLELHTKDYRGLSNLRTQSIWILDLTGKNPIEVKNFLIRHHFEICDQLDHFLSRPIENNPVVGVNKNHWHVNSNGNKLFDLFFSEFLEKYNCE